MTLHSTNDSFSIFEDGKLRPGIYKIQNIQSETFLDIEIHTREMCCRPAKDLGEGRGFWEIKRFGAGFTVQAVKPGEPEQFCTPMGRLDESPLVVSPYPVGWRIDVVDDDKHRGFEYVRFYWGTTNFAWSLENGSKDDGAKVWSWRDPKLLPRRIWKLIPVKVESTSVPSLSLSGNPGLDSLPSYDGVGTGQSTTRTQHVESVDELGTVVSEVTVVTTHKRYRVADP